jgi:pimeloyl-ACP methyl ester carboxylesterase
MNNIFLCLSLIFLSAVSGYGQTLKPGFEKAEYLELLKVCAQHGSPEYVKNIAKPQHSKFLYRSPVMGLENQWDLYMRDDNVAIISVRGTTASQTSWLANFYAAMVPAVGELHLNDTTKFKYHLANNPKAAVHVGWLLSTAYLSKDILPKLDSLQQKGIKNVIIMGHSQGGAIAYLLTAYLYELQKEGRIDHNIRFKTYCSAGPKPGNLYFAYDYETMTQGGWAYNVVNTADWVPETPVSIQTLNDFNTTNIFAVAPGLIKKQKFPMNWIGKYAYNRLSKPAFRAQRRYEKYLGRMVSKQVIKHLPAYIAPDYYHSTDYVRTGNFIVLQADAAYYKLYPDSKKNVFIHHFFEPYLYLAEQLPDTSVQP